MSFPEPIKATMVRTLLSGEGSLKEGEEVEVLELIRDGTSRWQVRVAGQAGREALTRPCLLGQCRKPEMQSVPELTSADLMVRELDFWRHLWESVSPRKARAMERLAYWISDISQEQEGELPLSVLHSAWTQYGKERRGQ